MQEPDIKTLNSSVVVDDGGSHFAVIDDAKHATDVSKLLLFMPNSRTKLWQLFIKAHVLWNSSIVNYRPLDHW